MTANLSKYKFLLQNDNDNFVVNSNVSIGDYNFDYLFTGYENKAERNSATTQAAQQTSNNAASSAANLSNKKSKEVESLNSNITSLISLIQNFNPTGTNRESRQTEFSKLFTEKDKEIMKQILESKKFQSALTDKTFSRNFADLISSLEPNIFKILVEIIESLSENAKKIYLNDKNTFSIKHLIENNNI
jgi:hypothetical protein